MKLISLAFIAVSVLGFYTPNPMVTPVTSFHTRIDSGSSAAMQVWYSRKGLCLETQSDLGKCLAAIR